MDILPVKIHSIISNDKVAKKYNKKKNKYVIYNSEP